jgi:hypothetical protein
VLPRGHGRIVLVEPVARLAETEQSRRRDRRVVEADDAAIAHRRVPEVAGRHRRVRVGDQVERLVATQPAGA